MPFLHLHPERRVWTSPPKRQLRVKWSNPLTHGLEHAFWLGTGVFRDLVTGAVPSGSPEIDVGSRGTLHGYSNPDDSDRLIYGNVGTTLSVTEGKHGGPVGITMLWLGTSDGTQADFSLCHGNRGASIWGQGLRSDGRAFAMWNNGLYGALVNDASAFVANDPMVIVSSGWDVGGGTSDWRQIILNRSGYDVITTTGFANASQSLEDYVIGMDEFTAARTMHGIHTLTMLWNRSFRTTAEQLHLCQNIWDCFIVPTPRVYSFPSAVASTPGVQIFITK